MSSFEPIIDSQDGGAMAEEAVSALIVDVLNGGLVHQHTPGDVPQGLDHAYVLDDQLHTAEVKGILGPNWHQSSTSRTVDGRQMDDPWVADRLDRIGIQVEPDAVGAEDDQVQTELFQVDFAGDTIARYDLDCDGRRSDTTPTEIYALSDVLAAHELSNVPDADLPDPVSEPLDTDSEADETYEDSSGSSEG